MDNRSQAEVRAQHYRWKGWQSKHRSWGSANGIDGVCIWRGIMGVEDRKVSGGQI